MNVCREHTTYARSCASCQMDNIEALLTRIADAVAPTPEQQRERYEAEDFERSVAASRRFTSFYPINTNAIGGTQTGRGVK